jgi:membrane fusion protein (multidrug efflux system)
MMPGRKLVRLLLLVVVPAIAIAIALEWYARSTRWAETENAYVKANVIAVSAEVSGRVAELAVRDQQRVERGALLFAIDPAPYQLAVQRAEAQLGVTRTEIETLRAEYRTALRETEEAGARITFLSRQLERQRMLKEKGMTREELYDDARNNLDSAERRIASLKESSSRALAALDGKPAASPEQHPRYRQALAALDAAKLDLARTRVTAPVAGMVSNLRLRPGMHVERGTPTFSLVEEGPLWIEANYKETQLTDMRVGQPATFTVDAYPGQSWQARVIAIAPATGAEFAVLPPQNATGNWVKVVQRIPVRIEVEEKAQRPPLRAGMTVVVSVDTGRERHAGDLLRAFFLPSRAEAQR